MRRFAAGVLLAAMLMLFVAVVTRSEETRAEGQETTMLVAAVECPCQGGCESHASMVCDYAPEYDEAEVTVLKLPTEVEDSAKHELVKRKLHGFNPVTILKPPRYVTEKASEAANVRGYPNVGVLL